MEGGEREAGEEEEEAAELESGVESECEYESYCAGVTCSGSTTGWDMMMRIRLDGLSLDLGSNSIIIITIFKRLTHTTMLTVINSTIQAVTMSGVIV